MCLIAVPGPKATETFSCNNHLTTSTLPQWNVQEPYGHSDSSTQRGLAYLSTKTQATEERPSCLKLAWKSTNGVLCQFPEAKNNHTGRDGDLC